MKRSPNSWQNVWNKLGFNRTSRRRASGARRLGGGYSRLSRMEGLEDRRLLAVGSFLRQDVYGADCWALTDAYAEADDANGMVSDFAGPQTSNDEILAESGASASAVRSGTTAEANALAAGMCPTPIGYTTGVARVLSSALAQAGVSSAVGSSGNAEADYDNGQLNGISGAAFAQFQFSPPPNSPQLVYHNYLYVGTYGSHTLSGGASTLTDLRADHGGAFARINDTTLRVVGRIVNGVPAADMQLQLIQGTDVTYQYINGNISVLYHWTGAPVSHAEATSIIYEHASAGDGDFASGQWAAATAAWGYADTTGAIQNPTPIILAEGDPVPLGFSVTPGDFNADGVVDGSDFDIFYANYGLEHVATPFHGDADGDRDVDGDDYAIWFANNTSTPIYFVSDDVDVANSPVALSDLSLRDAISLANSSAGKIVFERSIDEIQLDSQYGALAITSGTDVEIAGPGADELTIIGDGSHSVFTIASGAEVTMSDVTITGGYANKGGGIFSQADVLSLDSVAIVGNVASEGSGICHQYGSIEIHNCQIVDNEATWSGAGIQIEHCSDALVDFSTISENTAWVSGGGLLAWDTDLLVSNSTISLNSGGGLSLNDCDVELVDSTIESNYGDLNHSNLNGGGIGVWGPTTLDILSCTIANNDAPSGGGIYVSYGTTFSGTIVNSAIESNHATLGYGGGMYMAGSGTLDIVASTIAENDASHGGGGVYVQNSPTMSIINSTISSNTTQYNQGGGIYADQADLSIIQSTVTQNRTVNGGIGGGLYAGCGNYVLAKNSIFAENYRGTGSTVNDMDDIAGELVDVYSVNNLIGYADDLDFYDTDFGNIIGTDKNFELSELGNYGGPTRTHVLLSTSDAIDAGDNSVATAYSLDEDQRGEDRIDDWDGIGGDVIDIGAVELAFGETYYS